jgi:hypothetical protein
MVAFSGVLKSFFPRKEAEEFGLENYCLNPEEHLTECQIKKKDPGNG